MRTCRSGTAKAVAIASSVQFFEARSSIDSPEIDGRHGRAHDVFSDGAHVVEGIGRFDEDRHFLELVGDGALDAAAARDDGEGPVPLFGEERRLNESDRIAVGLEGRVGQAIGGDLPRVSLVGVSQGLGIDDAQFDCLFHCLAPGLSGSAGSLRNREPRSAGAGPGQRRRNAPGFGPDQRSGRPNPPFAADARPCSLALLAS